MSIQWDNDFEEGDRVVLTDASSDYSPFKSNMEGTKARIDQVGAGEANKHYYQVRFFAFGSWDHPYKQDWVEEKRLARCGND